jgi:hypothetical protein
MKEVCTDPNFITLHSLAKDCLNCCPYPNGKNNFSQTNLLLAPAVCCDKMHWSFYASTCQRSSTDYFIKHLSKFQCQWNFRANCKILYQPLAGRLTKSSPPPKKKLKSLIAPFHSVLLYVLNPSQKRTPIFGWQWNNCQPKKAWNFITNVSITSS